jgi:hypothetical protein
MQGKYKDRAEMRRQGVDDEYKGVSGSFQRGTETVRPRLTM